MKVDNCLFLCLTPLNFGSVTLNLCNAFSVIDILNIKT